MTWPRRTERLTIRPATEDDLPGMHAYRRLPEVAEWEPRQLGAFHHWLLHADGKGLLSRNLVVHRDGVLVGDLYLRVEDAWAQAEVADRAAGRQAEVGWTTDPAHQRNGYATEAARELLAVCFEELGVHRVVAETFAGNEASWRTMERIGMRREGYAVRDALHRSRGWQDSCFYGLLAEEWRALRSPATAG